MSADPRYFDSGAYRDTDENKLDYEGFLSPLVLERYAQYMHKNRKQSDGNMRAADNWQKGIPRSTYMKSMWRHFMDVFKMHRNVGSYQPGEQEEAICAVIFNAMGYLHEVLTGVGSQLQPKTIHEEWCGDPALSRPADQCTCDITPAQQARDNAQQARDNKPKRRRFGRRNGRS